MTSQPMTPAGLDEIEARAAAVQWVVYDGSGGDQFSDMWMDCKTLPHKDGYVAWWHKAGEYYTMECVGKRSFDPEPGDRWAYLPQPPEVKE